jgi:citrate lyase subunit beta/citryl-CoA lyase
MVGGPVERAQRPRRSSLSVPGSSPKMMAKAPSLAADEVFFDLEDSVLPDRKEEARDLVAKALADGDWNGKSVGIRVNGVDTRWCYGDVTELVDRAGQHLDFVMIPKVEEMRQVLFVDGLLGQVEGTGGSGGRIGIQVQIETAKGLTNVDGIARASNRIETLVFGPADMSASLGTPALSVGGPVPGYPGDPWHFVMSRILVAARSAGLQAIDGPYLVIEDLEGLRENAARARALGYDGKWAVHPSQIDVLNEVFAPTREEFERARAILDAYEQAAGAGRSGAVRLGSEMIDEASRKMADRVIARGAAAGMGEGAAGRDPAGAGR